MLEKTKAYIAGFLDGDGCVMVQLVPRPGYKFGYQVRTSIVFYQRINHLSFLRWLKHKLVVGYIRDRKDNMSEYTIVGMKPVKKILEELLPYIVLKRKQAKLTIEIIDLLDREKIDENFFIKVCKKVDYFKILNYSRKRMNTSLQVKEYLAFRSRRD